MPVSRKRKKNRKARTSTRQSGPSPRSAPDLRTPLTQLAGYRRQLDERRTAVATDAAEALVADLISLAAGRSHPDLEDELCARFGELLAKWDDAPVEENVDPNLLAECTIGRAADAVGAALAAPEPDAWSAPWRVLTAVAGIVPFPLGIAAADSVQNLRGLPGGKALPSTLDQPAVTGPVRWTRDRYGSRFGVTTTFSSPDGPDRWYLWDIDACGHMAATVHSGYYPTSEQALASWRAGVGDFAAGAAILAPVDDRGLLWDLLPAELGFMRPGGENTEQFAEYHRSKRLAEVVLEAVPEGGSAPAAPLDAATAGTEFTAWLRTHRAELPEPEQLAELVTELSDSWSFASDVKALYHTSSPHRVALIAHHMRDYYQDDFAAELVALLPDWVSWLAERNASPPDLVARCRPYAFGEPHPAIGDEFSYLARVAE